MNVKPVVANTSGDGRMNSSKRISVGLMVGVGGGGGAAGAAAHCVICQ
jgi:hypothetical protein